MTESSTPAFAWRLAVTADSDMIYALSARAQAALTRAGSLQHIGPIEPTVIREQIERNQVYLAIVNGERVGCVFVEPLTREQGSMWDFAPDGHWYLSKLMIEPSLRGQGYGAQLVEAILKRFAEYKAVIVLDCWAGNDKLRAFYAALGFRLHGIFDEEDYQIAVMHCDPKPISG